MFKIVTFCFVLLTLLASGCQSKDGVVKASVKSPVPKLDYSKYSSEELSGMYNKANRLIASGEMQKAEGILQKISNYHQPSNKLLKRLEAPFNLALKSVEDYIQDWLLRPTEVTPIQLRKPSYPVVPSPEVITKGEFETTKQFRIRLAQRKNIYKEKLNTIKQDYINKVDVYNTAIKAYNSEIHWEQKRRQEQVASMRSRLLNTAINEILGAPKLVNVKYNADKEVFTARVVASDNAVYYDVVIPVAISEAQNFKNDTPKSKILIKMNLDGKIKPVNFKIKNPKKTYTAYLLDSKGADLSTKQRSVGIAGIDLNNIKINKIDTLKVDEIIENNKQYFRKFEVTVDKDVSESSE